ncbi:MAG: HAD family hydrolase [Nostoc sp. SerVER01]|nr:HAD family hydrolase [Nostoc sp. SerVER01]
MSKLGNRKNIIFDLDDTLIIEVAAVKAALLATCERAHEKYGIDTQKFYHAVKSHGRQLWNAFANIQYCDNIGIGYWEGLWGNFIGNDPNLKFIRERIPTYKYEVWSNALAEFQINDSIFVQELVDLFGYELRQRLILFPEAESTLKQLSQNYRLALITNGISDLQHEKLEKTNLLPYFEHITISGEEGFGKPDPRIFELTLDKLGISAENAVMVGNNLSRDIKGAQKIGIRGIWINRFTKTFSQDICIPDAQISSLSELLRLF